MKTVYDLYHWTHPDACADITYGFATPLAAGHSAGIPAAAVWQRVRDNGWLIDPQPDGRQREWGIFERQAPETDADRVDLTLDLLATEGQVDGIHHKAWVIDQTVRLLVGDDQYDAWVADYRSGEDGPHTHSWDQGIAP